MPILTTLFEDRSLRVVDYRCEAGLPPASPFVERHAFSSVSFVRRGTFGYRFGARRENAHELLPGAVLVGRAGDEYVCTHDHRNGGDECLSIQLAPALADEAAHLGDDTANPFRSAAIPPIPELMVLAELADIDRTSGIGMDEAALRFVERFVSIVAGSGLGNRGVGSSSSARDRRRAIDAALYIDENASAANVPLTLDHIAELAGLSTFHFLRVFSSVTGVTPHQYIVRARLRRAARALLRTDLPITTIAFDVGFADLSNFVRTFRRAAGMSPRAFRKAGLRAADRKILQDRLLLSP